MVFRNIERIPQQVLTADYSFSTFSDDECEAAFDYAIGIVSRRAQRQVRLARIIAIAARGDADRAERELAPYTNGRVDVEPAVANVRVHIEACRRKAWGLD
jgi:hypothetical protein